MNHLVRILCAFLVSICPLAVAQVPGTGLYAFGSFDSKGFDSINLGNLNTHFEIPIVSKQGRGGLNFSYSLVYDGLIWSPVDSLGNSVWTADSGWGFHGVLLGGSFTGYVTHSSGSMDCFSPPHNHYLGHRTTNYVYHDPYGRNHVFDYQTTYWSARPFMYQIS